MTFTVALFPADTAAPVSAWRFEIDPPGPDTGPSVNLKSAPAVEGHIGDQYDVAADDADGHVHGVVRGVRPTGPNHVAVTVELTEADNLSD